MTSDAAAAEVVKSRNEPVALVRLDRKFADFDVDLVERCKPGSEGIGVARGGRQQGERRDHLERDQVVREKRDRDRSVLATDGLDALVDDLV